MAKKPPMPIKKGTGGEGKRAIASSGGGKKTLRTWRSMNKATKTQAKSIASEQGRGLSDVVRDYRTLRKARNVNPTTGEPGRNRRIAAGAATPKAAKTPMGTNLVGKLRPKGSPKMRPASANVKNLAEGLKKAGAHMRGANPTDIVGNVRKLVGADKAKPAPKGKGRSTPLKKSSAVDRYGSNLAKQESAIAKRRAASPGMTRSQAEELGRISTIMLPSAKSAAKRARTTMRKKGKRP